MEASECKDYWGWARWEVEAQILSGDPDDTITVEMKCGSKSIAYCTDDGHSPGPCRSSGDSVEGGKAVCLGTYDQTGPIVSEYEYSCEDPLYPDRDIPKILTIIDADGKIIEVRSLT